MEIRYIETQNSFDPIETCGTLTRPSQSTNQPNNQDVEMREEPRVSNYVLPTGPFVSVHIPGVTLLPSGEMIRELPSPAPPLSAPPLAAPPYFHPPPIPNPYSHPHLFEGARQFPAQAAEGVLARVPRPPLDVVGHLYDSQPADVPALTDSQFEAALTENEPLHEGSLFQVLLDSLYSSDDEPVAPSGQYTPGSQ